MKALDAIHTEIETLISIYGDPDLSYAPQQFRDQCEGRADGLRMALRIVDTAREAYSDDGLKRWTVYARGSFKPLGVYKGNTAEEAIVMFKQQDHATWLHLSNDKTEVFAVEKK